MITIKYKGVEADCTTVDEAVKLIKRLELINDNTIIIQPNVPNPFDPIAHPFVTWATDHLETYKYDTGTGICEYKSNLPDDYDNRISKINIYYKNYKKIIKTY